MQIVWAAIETFDPGLQYVLLQELAADFALAVRDPRTDSAKVQAAVAALREVAEIIGHPPSVGEYRAPRRPRRCAARKRSPLRRRYEW